MDPSGSHSVFVSTIRQNTALLVNSVKLNAEYHDLIDLLVCDRFSRECMMHHWDRCPGSEPLKNFLDDEPLAEDGDEGEITLKQRATSDQSELITRTELSQLKILLTMMIYPWLTDHGLQILSKD